MIDAPPRHRLLAILAADAAGYSRLMAADEHAALAALEAARTAFAEQAAAHAGRIVDTAGDSVLAVFETASGALDAALAIQERLAAELVGVPLERQMRFRIGVHLGDVIEKGDGSVYGNGVNVAARLQSLAEPGGIWISDALRGAIVPRLVRRFEDRGAHAVKNIAEPVHAFRLRTDDTSSPLAEPRKPRPRRPVALVVVATVAVAAAVAFWFSPFAHPGSTPAVPGSGRIPLSLMIGPLDPVAGDARARDAAERLRSDLGAGLSGGSYRQTRTVLVSRPGAASGPADSPLEQARRAGVRMLLDGDVRQDGDASLVTLRIADTDSGAQKWSRSVTLSPADAVRGPKVQQLVEEIAEQLRTSEAQRISALPIDRLSPAELHVRAGAVYDAEPNRAGIDKAIAIADTVLARDPNFVPMLALKAFMLFNRYDEEANPDHDAYARELDALTARALAVDSRDPNAWSMRAWTLLFMGRWASAEEALATYLRLAGPTSWAPVEKAAMQIYLGEPREALETMAAAGERSGEKTWTKIQACHSHLLLGDSKAAVVDCEKAVGRDPSLWSAHLYLAAARANLGELDAARASLAVVDRMSPGHTISRLRNYRTAAHPAYQRLAATTYYAGLAKAGMPDR